jgi:hypothetical protein
VQVDVQRVGAHLPRVRDSDEAVEVGAVHVQVRALLVEQPRRLDDLRLEHPEGVWDGDHERGHVASVEVPREHRQVERPLGRRRDLHRLETGENRRSRVRAVGRVRYQYELPMLAPVHECLADHQHSGELAVCSCGGLQRHLGHAGHCDKRLLQLPHEREGPLNLVLGLEGVELGDAGQAGQLLVDARVVLHRAGTERVEPFVDAVVPLRQTREVAHDIDLAYLGHPLDLAAQKGGRQGRRGIDRRHLERRELVADAALR